MTDGGMPNMPFFGGDAGDWRLPGKNNVINNNEMHDKEQLKEELVGERKELVERKEKFKKLLYSQDFMDLDMRTKTLMRSQLVVMNQYINILGWRLELLGVKPGCREDGTVEDGESAGEEATAD